MEPTPPREADTLAPMRPEPARRRVAGAAALFVLLAGGTAAADQAPTPAAPLPPGAAIKALDLETYHYTVRLESRARRQGAVEAGGVTWRCRAARCEADGPWATPSVKACRTLAMKVGPVRAYGHKGKKLDGDALARCNRGVRATTKEDAPAARLAARPPDLPAVDKGTAESPARREPPAVDKGGGAAGPALNRNLPAADHGETDTRGPLGAGTSSAPGAAPAPPGPRVGDEPQGDSPFMDESVTRALKEKAAPDTGGPGPAETMAARKDTGPRTPLQGEAPGDDAGGLAAAMERGGKGGFAPPQAAEEHLQAARRGGFAPAAPEEASDAPEGAGAGGIPAAPPDLGLREGPRVEAETDSPALSRLDPEIAAAVTDPRVTGYDPATAWGGREVTVLGQLLARDSGDQLVIGQDGGTGTPLGASSWETNRVRVRLPEGLAPGTYFIAVRAGDGTWKTNRAETLEVVGREAVTARMRIYAMCAIDVLHYPRRIFFHVTGGPLGEAGKAIPLPLATVNETDRGTKEYVYIGTDVLPRGSYRVRAGGAGTTPALFIGRDWEVALEDIAPDYPDSGACHNRRRDAFGVLVDAPRLDYPVSLGFEAEVSAEDRHVDNYIRLRSQREGGGLPGGAALTPPTSVDE